MIRALLLDMDGVLWRGGQPLGDLPALFEQIAALDLQVVFITNNATRSVAQYVERLHRLGVAVQPEQVLNSALAAAHALREAFPEGARVHVLGEGGLHDTLAEAGFRIANKEIEGEENGNGKTPTRPDAVVVALDRECTYDKLRQATLHIRNGALFIGTNPDRTYPTPEGLVPGAGSIIAALEAATDQPARIVGKPQPLLFQMALERLGIAPEEALVVGDRLETDIVGGQAAGCRTALVLSGVTTQEQAMAWEPVPDLIAPDLTAVVAFLARERAWQGKRIVSP